MKQKKQKQDVSPKDGFLTRGDVIVSLFADGNRPEKQKT